MKTPHPPCPATSKIPSPPWPWTSNFKQTPLPIILLQVITNQLKENIIHGWLLHVVRSFLQVGFCSQYQLFNLAWLLIGFYPFSWSQPRAQSYFKKLKTFFSASSYGEKMCCGQGWAEASLSVFLLLYILLCAVAQKYQKMVFIYNYSQF